MNKQEITFYERLMYAAYGYYMLLGTTFVVFSILFGTHFNFEALIAVAMFGVQVYYRNKLVNLILGIILLALSIFWLLQFLLEGGKSGFDVFINVMLGLSVVSIAAAGILIFSYLKLSFKD